MPKTFTLTVAQDFINAADGGGDTFLAGLNGIFGNQPTLTVGDTLTDTGGNNNQLDAFFNYRAHSTHNIVGTTIEGIQTWNFTNFGDDSLVDLFGGVNVGGADGTHSPGVRTITYENSLGSMIVGGGAVGIESLVTTLTVANDDGDVHQPPFHQIPFLSVDENRSVFKGVTNPTLNVNINSLTNGVGNPQFVGARGFAGDYAIIAGPNTGTTGYQTWNLQVQDSTGDNIVLGALSATNATTINITDASGQTGGLLLDSALGGGNSAASWANLRLINAGGLAGTLVVSGLEGPQSGAGAGFLSDLTGAAGTFQIIGGGGNGNFVDLTAWTHTAANLFVNLGFGTGNELDLNSNIVDTTVAFGQFTGVAILGDVETAGGSLGGNINMALFPGVSEIILKAADGDSDPVQSTAFNITNAPNNLTFDFQDTNQAGNNFGIIGVGGPGDTLTVDYGVASTSFSAHSTGVFLSQGYDNVDINVTAINDANFYTGGVIAVANTGDAETLTINTDVNLDVGHLGASHIGVSSLTLLGGTLLAPTTGTLDITGTGNVTIGVTDAFTIDDTGTGALIMDAPGNDIVISNLLTGTPVYTGITVTADGAGSILQGTMGHLDHLGASLGGGATGNVGTDVLSDTAGGSSFYGDGGLDTINLGGGGNTVFVGTFLNGATQHQQVITDTNDNGYTGFWGNTSGHSLISGSTSADMSVINGFQIAGTSPDTLDFNVSAWAGGTPGALGAKGDLVGDNGNVVSIGNAAMQLITSPGLAGEINLATNFVLYAVDGGLPNASALASALSGVGAINTQGAIAANTHMLFAYDSGGDIKIADVDFGSAIAAGGSTAGAKISVSDVADIVGGNTGLNSMILLGINPADVHFSSHLG
jgi:hypothetical protein